MHNKPHSNESREKMSIAHKGKPNLSRRRETIEKDGILLYKCGKCGEFKPYDAFYKDKRTLLGIKSECKVCHCQTTVMSRDKDKARKSNKEYARRRHQLNPEAVRAYWRTRKEKDPQKIHARSVLNSAVRHGKIQRPDCCERCGRIGMVYGHHEDYSKPLDVVWLCSDCHGEQHRKPA